MLGLNATPWGAKEEKLTAIISTLAMQSNTERDTDFGKPRNCHIFAIFTLPLELPYTVERSPQAMQSGMMNLESAGYMSSARDRATNFGLYAELLDVLGIPTDIPAVYFFHGSATPPDIIFREGVDVEMHGDPDAFLGKRLYGAAAGRALDYARPYLYLFMMLLYDEQGQTRICTRVDGPGEQPSAEVAIIHTDTATQYKTVYGYVGSTEVHVHQPTFLWPELAIAPPPPGLTMFQHGIFPVACFMVDTGATEQYPEWRDLASGRIPFEVAFGPRQDLLWRHVNAADSDLLWQEQERILGPAAYEQFRRAMARRSIEENAQQIELRPQRP